MLRVRYLVLGEPRVDIGTVASEQHLPAKGERVELQGVSYRVQSREWKYTWDKTGEAPLSNLSTTIEIDLVGWNLT